RPGRRLDRLLRPGAPAPPGPAGGGAVTPKFKVGDVAEELITLEPVRVIQEGELNRGTYLVQFLESGRWEWVREGDLRLLWSPREIGNVACGFCVALDGGTCVDCEGYTHMAAERTDEDRAYDAAARARSVENDPVNHPGHYNRGKIEVIDFITDQGFNYARGNAVKYISRAGYKNPDTEIEDLEKARFYIDYEIKRLKAQGES